MNRRLVTVSVGALCLLALIAGGLALSLCHQPDFYRSALAENVPPAIRRDAQGFVLTGSDVAGADWPLEREPFLLETSVPGVFAAGDARSGSAKRVASAVGEGAMSIYLIHRYLAIT